MAPVRSLMKRASADLLADFTLCQSSWKPRSTASGSSRRSSSRFETHRSPMLPRDQRAQLRIAQHDPPARRHAVGHVHELLRRHPIEVAEHGLLEQLRVQRRDPVDRVAADARQVRHAHALVPGLVDDREPPRQLIVAGMTLPHVIEEATVDLVNDLEMAWQHHAEQRQRPFLERFGKQGVVRVAARPFRDAPRGIPVQLVLVHEQPHQLGDRDRRVRVVQLCGPAGVELVERLPAQQVQPDHVLEGARHEKVLLLEAELLAGLRLVVRVEHLRDRLGRDFLVRPRGSSPRG